MKNPLDQKASIELKSISKKIWKETLLLHKRAPETRLASSLSVIETLVTLFYGGFIKFESSDPMWDGRDRLILSKGHGTISMYPILADLGYFDSSELKNICKEGSFLGAIPDPIIPGYETVNGSLGHGLGVSCGIAVALKQKQKKNKVFVITGDGELYEGSNWEAIMFAAHNQLENLIAIVDHNKVSMLDYCENIVSISPLVEKFRSFGWEALEADGHDIGQLYQAIDELTISEKKQPKVLIAHTIKGKGVPLLEKSSLSHILTLKPEDIDNLVKGEECQ